MYNYFMLIGRVVEKPTIEDLGDGRKKAVIKLKVNRTFSNINEENVNKEDVFNVTFCDFLIDYIQENLNRGFPVMVKGRMWANEKGIELIGERIGVFSYSQEGR